jgi:hypothetical protein
MWINNLIGEGKLDHHTFPQVFVLFMDTNFGIKFEGKIKKHKTQNTVHSKQVLNEAKNAYLELSETDVLSPSCHTLKFTLTLHHTSNSVGGSEENAPSNYRFPKPTGFIS